MGAVEEPQSAANLINRQLGGPQRPLEPITGTWEKRGALAASIGMFFFPGPEEMEGASLASKWSEGSFGSVEESLSYHFGKHGAEVGATTMLQYLRKADAFAANLQRARRVEQAGGAVNFIKNGRFIIKSIEGKILSFGLVGN